LIIDDLVLTLTYQGLLKEHGSL